MGFSQPNKPTSQQPTHSHRLQMATTGGKPQRTPAEIEDIILRKIFAISLTIPPSTSPNQVVYLEMTAAEILSEGKPLILSRDIMERVLIDRLSGSFPGVDPPFSYLVSFYRRACDEAKKITSMKDPVVRAQIEAAVRQAKKMAVDYSRIHLGDPDMFAGDAGDAGVSRDVGFVNKTDVICLLNMIFSEVSSSLDSIGGDQLGSGVSSPPGFLADFFGDADFDGLKPVMDTLYNCLRTNVMKVSALGNFQQPIKALLMLVRYPVCANCLVRHPNFIAAGDLGRLMEASTVLGAFFHVSAIPDHAIFKSKPDVGQQCFQNLSNRRSADMYSSFTTIKTLMNNLYDGLSEVFLILLRNVETREFVLQFIAEMIKKNTSRSKMQMDPISCASNGSFLNLSAVMLRLCEPFLDARLSKRDKIDPEYVFYNNRLDLRQLTALNASSEEVKTWVESDSHGKSNGVGHTVNKISRSSQSHEASSSGNNSGDVEKKNYPFICECFFMTSRVLNLGLIKSLSEFKNIMQELSQLEDGLSNFRAMNERTTTPQIEQDISRLEKKIEKLTQERYCFEAQVFRDGYFLQQALSFYRFVVIWLVSLVGGFGMPLPPKCPMKFACMPEHLIEDVVDLLIFTSRVPKALDGVILDEFLNFIIMFMGSPSYVKNPYLRAKMVEVLNCWMPQKSGLSSTSSLFDGHQLSLDYLVQNLLKLYVDIEFTGSHNQFYDKFTIRHNIAELLEYLWNVPSHRTTWRRIAKEEEKGVYLNFLNFLINDSIFLLDESLNKILELKELEAEMADTVEWERRPPQEREETSRLFHSHENFVRFDMKLANEDVGMLAFTSEQIPAPFLLPEMVERVASMLNYFLLQLVGPQRKSLTLKDPEKYEFRPKTLLKQIVEIYVHIARGDKGNVFPSSISKDGRSYNEKLFSAAANVLQKIGEDRRVIEEFIKLGVLVKTAATEAMNTEEVLGEIPEEFLDPIQYTLMKDPVILPSSRIIVDRAVIQRHLLSDNTDPFNRSPLTQDMLIPDVELKAKIEEFINQQFKPTTTDMVD